MIRDWFSELCAGYGLRAAPPRKARLLERGDVLFTVTGDPRYVDSVKVHAKVVVVRYRDTNWVDRWTPDTLIHFRAVLPDRKTPTPTKPTPEIRADDPEPYGVKPVGAGYVVINKRTGRAVRTRARSHVEAKAKATQLNREHRQRQGSSRLGRKAHTTRGVSHVVTNVPRWEAGLQLVAECGTKCEVLEAHARKEDADLLCKNCIRTLGWGA